MPTCRALPWFVVATALAASSLRLQQIPEPKFTDGDLGKISCRVTRVKPSPIGTARVMVEVNNRTAHAFEPTVFALKWQDASGETRSTELARAPMPRMRRVGRLVAARKKESYALQIATDSVKSLEVRVVEGLFSDAASLDANPIEVGAIRHDTTRHLDGTVPTTKVGLRNSLPHPVDVILHAHCTAPKDGDVLVTARLQGGEEREWEFLQMPTALEWEDIRTYYPGIRIESLQVVDWSARLPPDPTAAADLLRPAYEAWLRWPERGPALRGRFVIQDVSTIGTGPQRTELEGTFAIDAEGRIQTRANTPAARAEGRQRIDWALRDLRRPSFGELLQENELQLMAPGQVMVSGPGWTEQSGGAGQTVQYVPGVDGAVSSVATAPTFPVYLVNAEEIAGSGSIAMPRWARWTTRALGEGYTVVERSMNNGTLIERYGYRMLGEHAVPTMHRKTMLDAKDRVLSDEILRLDGLVLDPSVDIATAEVPTGPAAAALREAWDRIYHYPDEPVNLTARFAVKNPGTDMVWLGTRSLQGSLRVSDFVGFRWTRSGWDRIQVTLEGRPLPHVAQALSFAVTDRLGMWSGRDPSALGSFDDMFRGATIEWNEAAGIFRVEGGRIRELRVADGRILSAKFGGGIERRYKWKELGGRLVAVRIRSGEETITARWRKVGELLLPVSVEFRDVFGTDWGPETLTLEDVRID